MEFLWAVLHRQWPILIVIVLASGTLAWFVSAEYRTSTVTAQLELKSQPLPVTDQKVYTTPNPEVASTLLMSPAVLEPVIGRHGLPQVQELPSLLSVKPDVRTGIIRVELKMSDRKVAVEALNDLGNEFVKAITQLRLQTLAKHSDYLSTLKLSADNEWIAAVTAFDKHQTSKALDDEEMIQSAEVQALVSLRIQLESSVDQKLREQARIRRNQQVIARDMAAVRDSICREVLAGRERQAESLGKGLTSAARIVRVKKQIEDQLAQLQTELAALTARTERSDKGDTIPVVDASEDAALIVQTAGAETSPSPVVPAALTTLDFSAIQKEVSEWIAKVSDAGQEALGDLDPRILEAVESSQSELENLANSARTLQFEIDDNRDELKALEAQQSDLAESMRRATKKAGSQSSVKAMEVQRDLDQKEENYTKLAEQLDQIHHIRDCQLPEYIVSRSATLLLAGEGSNRKKLFAFILLGSGIVLLIPSAVFEILRMRPTPVNVVSRRWNLPVLGIQSTAGRSNTATKDLSGMSQQELRLMALRIQQSLFQPKGRVVLFSGLDHEESPMSLIRSLASCFSQREESVLMIQALPCQLEIKAAKEKANSSLRTHNPGVAEFLAGDYDDATQLVKGTGVAGVDFLPGGCTVTASEAVASSRLTKLIDQFRERYSMILLCGPSTLHPADLQMLAARADGIVFTVNKQSLKTVYGAEVISDLIELGAPILGFAAQPLRGKKAFPADQSALEEPTRTTAAISA
jgi:Mrp family chromosome partitioning ATPase